MHATSTLPDTWPAGSPLLEQVRDDVWALAQPMSQAYLRYSFAYLLRDTDGWFHVIDPGSESASSWANLIDALATLGASPADVRSITGTHMHPDHIGCMERLHRASGAATQLQVTERDALSGGALQAWATRSLGDDLARWGVPDDRWPEMLGIGHDVPPASPAGVDRALEDGQRLDIPGFDITVMLTPGHTSGHICLRDDSRGLLYSGDLLLPTIYPGLGLGGLSSSNALADYLNSLERVSRYPDYEVLPGHGYRFLGLAERAAQSAEHHLRRTREVAAAIAGDGTPTTWQVASRLTWSAGWQNLHDVYLYSALLQTDCHRDYVLNHAGGGPGSAPRAAT